MLDYFMINFFKKIFFFTLEMDLILFCKNVLTPISLETVLNLKIKGVHKTYRNLTKIPFFTNLI